MNTASTTTPAGEADLISHEWNENHDCITPERVEVDFGPKGKGRALNFFLGSTGVRWHVGWHAITKDDEHAVPCSSANDGYATRQEALHAGLVATAVLFAKDKHCSKCLEAFFEQIGSKPTLINQFAANEGDPMRPPLPRGRFAELSVTSITPNPENHRKHFDEIAMAQLTASIREHGLLQPIAVRMLSAEEAGVLPGVDDPRYEIILGERRWRAHVEAKLPTIDAKVYEGVTRAQAKAAALVENLQRQDINAVEEAEGYRDLMEAEGLTQEDVALRVGRSRPAVANTLRLLNLPDKTLEAIRRGDLTPAHGVALARFRPKKDELFPTWRQVVEVITEEAILGKLPAGALEKGVPCLGALERAGLVCRCNTHEVGGEWPKEILDHPAYVASDYEWQKYCFEPGHWQGLVEAYEAEREEQAKREKEKQEAALKKGKVKLTSLDDLPRKAYESIDAEEQPELLELLPEKRIVPDVARWEGADDKVTICTAPTFARRVAAALSDLKREDRKAKMADIFEQARERIRRIRKIDARVTALLIAVLADTDGEYDTRFSAAAAESQGVKVPAVLKPQHSWSRLAPLSSKVFAAIADDAVGMVRVLLDDYVIRHFADEGDFDAEDPAKRPQVSFDLFGDDVRAFLCYLLELPNLGLLEETKGGRKKLIEKVRAQDWYAAALAEAEKNGDMTEGVEEEEDEADEN